MAEAGGIFTFLQHVVGVRMEVKTPKGKIGKTYSSFFFHHERVSFLVTAGHILETIKEHIIEFKLDNIEFSLVDTATPNSKFRHRIPFSKELMMWSRLSIRTDRFDFGYIPLLPHFARLLNQNELFPLTEEWLPKKHEKFETYFIAGIPSEMNDPAKKGLPGQTGYCVKNVRRIKKPGNLIVKYPRNTFFAEAIMDQNLVDLDGMSGGPIFGLTNPRKGRPGKYKLVAVQAGWIKKKVVVGCSSGVVYQHILKFIQGLGT